jgi:multicomponent Na+:H+ antiporter subunit D
VSHIPVLIPLSLIVSSLLALLAGLRDPRWGHRISLGGASASFLFSLAGIRAVAGDGMPLRYALGNWMPPVGIEFVLDSLGAYMAGIITFIGVVVLVYAPRSLARETPGREMFTYPAMLLLLTGLTGISLTGDIFNLYVFLEIAAIAGYALLATGDRAAPVAAFRYLIIGSLGGGFYLLGVAFLYFSAGTLNMADLQARLPDLVGNRAVISAAAFMTVGLGVKMALFPLHFWLPDAYTNSPSATAGLIAPLMTKVAAFAIIRFFLDVFPPSFLTEALPLASTVGWLSAGGILFGSVMAVAQQDYRRMLAYSSVGQIAYVGLGLGLANPVGMIGGLLHILNHALMKGCLFLIGGSIRYRTGVTRIGEMRGMGRLMPWTMAAFVVAALAMIGIPPTAGFFSKWYLILGTLEAGRWWWFGVIILSSLLTAVYFFRTVEMIFREPERGDPAARIGGVRGAEGTVGSPSGEGHGGMSGATEGGWEAPLSMLLPILVLGAAILGAGLMNVLIVDGFLEGAVMHLGE